MILREGVPPLLVTVLAGAVGHGVVGWTLSIPAGVLVAYLLWVFWERRPPLPSEPKAVLSPVRGRVLGSVVEHDPWLHREARRVRVKLPLPGIVPLRAPVEGQVMEFFTARGIPGESLAPCPADASPDCYVSWLRTDEGEDVVYAVSSRWPFSRARFHQAPGERVGHGKRSGFVYFASVADVLIPTDSPERAAPRDFVRAGVSILAQLKRR